MKPVIRPPKNMTSVARKVHMPRLAASCCWSRSSKWWASGPGAADSWCWATRPGADSAMVRRLPTERIDVRASGHDRDLVEVVGRRRRRDLPLQPRGAPRVRARLPADLEREDQVGQGQEVADGEDRRPGRGHDVEHLELGRIL